jgi:peptidoglycan LD-endopeptidase CwlK
MYKFSNSSLSNLNTCDDRLKKIFEEVIKYYDCSIIEGHRGKDRQDKAYKTGKSKVQYPNSKHNKTPSLAVDVIPFPADFTNIPKNINRYYHFAGFVKCMSEIMNIKITWGGDWNNNKNFLDQTFDDLPHFELI